MDASESWTTGAVGLCWRIWWHSVKPSAWEGGAFGVEEAHGLVGGQRVGVGSDEVTPRSKHAQVSVSLWGSTVPREFLPQKRRRRRKKKRSKWLLEDAIPNVSPLSLCCLSAGPPLIPME